MPACKRVNDVYVCNNQKRKHIALTVMEKVEILKQMDDGATPRFIAESYGIAVRTVYDIRKNKEKLLKFYCKSDTDAGIKNRKSLHNAKSTELDAILYEWFLQQRSDGVPISGRLLRDKAKELHKDLNIVEPCDFTSGWLKRFKERHGIQYFKACGEKHSADTESAEEFIEDADTDITDIVMNLTKDDDVLEDTEKIPFDEGIALGERYLKFLKQQTSQKPSYKRIKGMVDALITKQIKNICAAPCDEDERLRRKTVVAEMSIMAYTIDTVISQILYTKLQNEFVTIIKDMIQELKKDDDAARAAEASSVAHSRNNKKVDSIFDVESQVEKSDKNAEATSIDKNSEDFSLTEDSDAESDISIGKLSMDSVSSVHTSELSSFDDEISISSGDESPGKKKKISYKEANHIFLQGKLSEIYRVKEKNVPKSPKEFHPTKRVAKDSLDEEFTCDYVHDDSSVRKTLPPRVRKPNSKYASESIFCPIKFSPSHMDTNSSPSTAKVAEPPKVTEPTKVTSDSSPVHPTRKRGRPRKQAWDGITAHTSAKMDYLEDVARDIAAVKGITLIPGTQPSGERSPRQCESSDLYKQKRTVSSQPSKKCTAVTLFTNAMKESSPEN